MSGGRQRYKVADIDKTVQQNQAGEAPPIPPIQKSEPIDNLAAVKQNGINPQTKKSAQQKDSPFMRKKALNLHFIQQIREQTIAILIKKNLYGMHTTHSVMELKAYCYLAQQLVDAQCATQENLNYLLRQPDLRKLIENRDYENIKFAGEFIAIAKNNNFIFDMESLKWVWLNGSYLLSLVKNGMEVRKVINSIGSNIVMDVFFGITGEEKAKSPDFFLKNCNELFKIVEVESIEKARSCFKQLASLIGVLAKIKDEKQMTVSDKVTNIKKIFRSCKEDWLYRDFKLPVVLDVLKYLQEKNLLSQDNFNKIYDLSLKNENTLANLSILLVEYIEIENHDNKIKDIDCVYQRILNQIFFQADKIEIAVCLLGMLGMVDLINNQSIINVVARMQHADKMLDNFSDCNFIQENFGKVFFKYSAQIRKTMDGEFCMLSDSKTEDHYKILGVERDATRDEIGKKYRALAAKEHPDKVPPDKRDLATKKFQPIVAAYEVLSDENARRTYDAKLAKEEASVIYQYFTQAKETVSETVGRAYAAFSARANSFFKQPAPVEPAAPVVPTRENGQLSHLQVLALAARG